MKDLEIVYGDLTSACHRVNNKLYIYSTIDSIYSHHIVVREIRRIIRVLNLSNVVFWSYNPLFTDILEDVGRRTINRRAFVFDAVDNWLEHPAFKKHEKDLKVGYQIIRQDADLIFTVSEYLQKKLFFNQKNCFWLPNGIDPEHFFIPDADYQIPEELEDIKRPIIGYHGVIEGRVDFDLIKYLAEKNPDKSIVLIGAGIWKKNKKVVQKILGDIDNVYLIPFVPYQELPKYLHAFDIGIVPHKINEFTKSMNPLKLYEFSAAGLPTVSTSVAGIETFRNILYMADTYEEFNQKIQLALREDNKNLHQTRQEVIADDSWYGRMQLMLKYLFDFLGN
jgi:glycosyltransferase involved in cell wall biosynthesis